MPFAVLRVRARETGLVRRAKVRSASLTARAFGNISATSRSSNTTLVPSAYRAAVTPRTALEKSYSARIVSSSMRRLPVLALLFFIGFSFKTRRLARTDDSSVVLDLSLANDQQTIPVRQPDYGESLFGFRMVGIRHVHRQWIAEGGDTFFEGDTMLLAVRLGLLRIPLEVVTHAAILRRDECATVRITSHGCQAPIAGEMPAALTRATCNPPNSRGLLLSFKPWTATVPSPSPLRPCRRALIIPP